MLVLRDPASASGIGDSGIRALVEQRFIDICPDEDYDADVHGVMIVVEPGDSAEVVEGKAGCSILRSPFGGARFSEPEFCPAFEVLEEHANCYEMVIVPGDGDFGIVIFIPKVVGIDAELLAMCATYAVPAPELSPP